MNSIPRTYRRRQRTKAEREAILALPIMITEALVEAARLAYAIAVPVGLACTAYAIFAPSSGL